MNDCTTEITMYVEEDGYEAEVTMTVNFEPGVVGTGSFNAPSDVDYYGCPPALDNVEEVTEITVYHDDAPANEKGHRFESLTGWEFDRAARDLKNRVEEGDLVEAAEVAFDEAMERLAERELDCRW